MRDLSLQKISANRKNAQLSTGLKTVLGKAKSALNAVKHGISTKRCLRTFPMKKHEITKHLSWVYLRDFL